MTSIMLSLLQSAALLLTAAQAQPSAAAKTSAIHFGSQAVQIVEQQRANIPFAVAKNNSIWPNIDGLYNAAYRSASGEWVRLGNSVELLAQYTSFGDLNLDGVDDAAVVVNKLDAQGGAHYFLVAMLNQGGVMFDIAELPLGGAIAITDHHVVQGGGIVIDKVRYELLGNALRKI